MMTPVALEGDGYTVHIIVNWERGKAEPETGIKPSIQIWSVMGRAIELHLKRDYESDPRIFAQGSSEMTKLGLWAQDRFEAEIYANLETICEQRFSDRCS